MRQIYERIAKALAVYRDRRMVIIAGLGFSSGLPILLVYSTLLKAYSTLSPATDFGYGEALAHP